MNRSYILNQQPIAPGPVIYLMSRDQRVHDNHALSHAQDLALKTKSPLLVLFTLAKVAERSREHYEFMMDGLKHVRDDLVAMNISFVLRIGDSVNVALQVCRELQAGALVLDFNPLQRSRNQRLTEVAPCHLVVVDAHNIVPTWELSDKQEFAAHTIRRKVHHKLDHYLQAPPRCRPHPYTAPSLASVSAMEVSSLLREIPASGVSYSFASGETAALSHLSNFIGDGGPESKLAHYAHRRNDIAFPGQSDLSPYLHYGHVSSQRVAWDALAKADSPPLLFEAAVLNSDKPEGSYGAGMDALYEEMIVRKELSDNFCFYAPQPRSLNAAHPWAQATLEDHRADLREYIYTRDDWELAATHDPAWNAAQTQLRRSGKIHGYMRMYWAKKMLEWSVSPELAFADCVYLNDKYSVDGGDPNGYVGILWSIAGLHDRAWTERPVFGKIRYMNSAGLKRKFKLQEYIDSRPVE